MNAIHAADTVRTTTLASFETLSLRVAGRAIYTDDDWKDGRNRGGLYVAQVFSEGDKDLPECAEMLGRERTLENDCEGYALATLMAASPRLLSRLVLAEQIMANIAAGITPSQEEAAAARHHFAEAIAEARGEEWPR